MNKLKNKDGSAILWTVLLTIIITILLGTLLTLAYGYHNSTIATVKKQQAYFTARSVTDAIISEFGKEGSESKLMPIKNGTTKKIDNLSFSKNMSEGSLKDISKQMGKAKAKVKKVSDDTVEVEVTATYADEKYTMTATLKKQPIYFGGIAVKSLKIPSISNLTLNENTDLYIDNTNGFKGKLNIGGNLICKGDITLLGGSQVCGTTFNTDRTFDNNLATTNPKKQIWTSTKYIISNYSMEAKYPEFVQTTRMLVKSILKGNYDREACNNVYGFPFEPNSTDDLDLSKYALTNSCRYVKITNFDSVTGRYFAEEGIADRAHTSVYNWWLPLYRGWKISDGVYKSEKWSIATYNNIIPDYMSEPTEAYSAWKNFVTPVNPTYMILSGILLGCDRFLRNDTYDINQIKYTTSDATNKVDDVTSVAYILVDKNCKLRIRYGLSEEYKGIAGDIQDIINALLEKKLSYIYVYLDDGAILELGKNACFNDEDMLNFYMTIYGTENSKVILHDNVKVHGSINVGELEVAPGADASINYITSNGGQVAKKQVDELWTLSNYSD